MPDKSQSCLRARAYKGINRTLREGDYAYARNRARNHSGRLERGYEVAAHFAREIASRKIRYEPDLVREFTEHAERWKDETGHLSSLTKAFAHPSYLRIIGLSHYSSEYKLESLLLHELKDEPDHWFAALSAITGEDPVLPEDDFDQAVKKWLKWGREKGIL
jgi:hypothetical protein